MERQMGGSRKQAQASDLKMAQAATGTPADRHQLIALAAYFRAEARGFTPGRELEDWLAAEQEIAVREPIKH